MSYKKTWDLNDVIHQINSAGAECNKDYNDGFMKWSIKQDLYKIKWRLEEILGECPTFPPEEKFLELRDQQLMWGRLKK